MARTFSADLSNAFSMDKDLTSLEQSVEQKKQSVSSQNQELEALEARLKETEERLKQKQSGSYGRSTGNSTPHRRLPLGDTFGVKQQGGYQASHTQNSDSQQIAQPFKRSDKTPSQSTMTYWKPEMPGTLPEMPSEGGQSNYVSARR
ncbi:MAG: hypothetical protein Q9214_002855 [Letrouitia sp. 1 TL-2023]